MKQEDERSFHPPAFSYEQEAHKQEARGRHSIRTFVTDAVRGAVDAKDLGAALLGAQEVEILRPRPFHSDEIPDRWRGFCVQSACGKQRRKLAAHIIRTKSDTPLLSHRHTPPSQRHALKSLEFKNPTRSVRLQGDGVVENFARRHDMTGRLLFCSRLPIDTRSILASMSAPFRLSSPKNPLFSVLQTRKETF
jgi:hypothetical protein